MTKPKVIPREKPPANFSFKPATFDLPPSIHSISKDSPLGFDKFIGRNPFDLRSKPSIFSFLPSSSFSSSSNPFLVENSCAIGEDAAATQTDTTIIARSDIAAPQIDVKDDDVRADVTDDVVASINPPFVVSYDFSAIFHNPNLAPASVSRFVPSFVKAICNECFI